MNYNEHITVIKHCELVALDGTVVRWELFYDSERRPKISLCIGDKCMEMPPDATVRFCDEASGYGRAIVDEAQYNRQAMAALIIQKLSNL